MDVILDAIFEHVFSKLDRGCLLARYKRRQLTDYLSTVIRGSAADDTQEGCRRAVRAAIRFHRNSKEANGKICLLGKFHNVLYVAATLCFDWKLEDSEIVAELLHDIFDCECTFERLFVGAILGTKVTHLISGWKSDFRSKEECIDAVKYFLDHSTKAGLRFQCSSGDSRKFVDVPMESYGGSTPLRVAAQAGQPGVISLLLHYGAVVTPLPDPNTCALQLLLRRMNDFCHDRPEEPIPSEFILCLNLLLRDFPRVPQILPDPEDDPDLQEVREIHPRMIAMVSPEKSGLTIVPSLRQLCRCSARQQLAVEGLLPYGVSKMSLPDSVVDYLLYKND
ncbi:uncharacterized protein LOC128986691 [Macrosteles quadrilineatus]|uniref:uncharacterized protein LOC128986691 n=1 Tax=Macrosteles quadrilineatus TaxID=74068 RepID=UPI0023E31564|nr:uncharacterized protein LOC128986691 [Macrosteles quadrilineatus]